jgi:hypothetical protein
MLRRRFKGPRRVKNKVQKLLSNIRAVLTFWLAIQYLFFKMSKSGQAGTPGSVVNQYRSRAPGKEQDRAAPQALR